MRRRIASTVIILALISAAASVYYLNPLGWTWVDHLRGAPDRTAADHEHQGTQLWTCGMHPQVMTTEPGSCPICKMDLVPMRAGKEKSEQKIKYYRSPMDPMQTSPVPGKDSMGHDMVPVHDEEGPMDTGTVHIDPSMMQNMGVKSRIVRLGELRNEIRTVGILDYNEKAISWVNVKFEGWIERVHVNYVSEEVKRGQPLFEIYSPELVTTQEDYLSALDYAGKLAESSSAEAAERAAALVEASRQRLRYWDISEAQIEQLERTRKSRRTLTITSPVSGIVVQKADEALEGFHIMPGLNLYKIADLSTIWLHAEIYEYQAPWLAVGQTAEITLPYFPGRTFHGKTLFLYPYMSEKTRTLKACLELDNKDRLFRKDMYADIRIRPGSGHMALLVPKTAIIRTGERDVAIVDHGNGTFEPRNVLLGGEGPDAYEVLSGLQDGDRVVTSGQFLIDSESNLQEAVSKMLGSRESTSTPPTPVPEAGAPSPGAQGPASAALNPLGRAVESYLAIWRLLAADTHDGVAGQAEKLLSALRDPGLHLSTHSSHTALPKLTQAAELLQSPDLEDLRRHFKQVSQAMVELLRDVGSVPGSPALQVKYCPFVDAQWIQDTNEVRNPFVGRQMKTCGQSAGSIP